MTRGRRSGRSVAIRVRIAPGLGARQATSDFVISGSSPADVIALCKVLSRLEPRRWVYAHPCKQTGAVLKGAHPIYMREPSLPAEGGVPEEPVVEPEGEQLPLI